MINVIATITLKPGCRDAFLERFHALMPHVHAEQGCLEYFPSVDVDSGVELQGPLRERTVTILEKWESLSALQAHLAAAHMDEFRESVAEIVEDLQLQILTPA